ncbi:MAG: DUF2283 domain-containing protein [Candidatus Cloacimonadota bacterium]|nr:MAG: DUF2283 domain-containing protein [Candidatus Cloacimonadota bacterium]
MKINYDPEADAIYIEFLKHQAVDNIDLNNDVSVDLDKNNKIIGIEILRASANLKKELFHLEFTQIPRRQSVRTITL